MKKVCGSILLLLLAIPAFAMDFGRTFVTDYVCDYETVTTITHEGDEKCDHEWVEEPQRLGLHTVAAVYCQCGCGDGGINSICRKCLRKKNTTTVGHARSRPESEYEKLNRQLEGK